MKKLFLLLVMSLAFMGCSSDDDSTITKHGYVFNGSTRSWYECTAEVTDDKVISITTSNPKQTYNINRKDDYSSGLTADVARMLSDCNSDTLGDYYPLDDSEANSLIAYHAYGIGSNPSLFLFIYK